MDGHLELTLRRGAIYVLVPSILDEESARTIDEELVRIVHEQRNGEPTAIVINLAGLQTVTAKARQILAESARRPEARRIALVGGTVFIRAVTNFIFRTSGQTHKQRFFSDSEEARRWASE